MENKKLIPNKLYDQTNAIRGVQVTLLESQQRGHMLNRRRNGQNWGLVTNSKTLNYKSLSPEPGGLFCQRIFGPVQDYICACGKKPKKDNKNGYCPKCNVEFISSRSRRYRLGYILLAMPMVHTWYLHGRPSYLPLLCDMKKFPAVALTYGARTIFNSFSREFADRIYPLRHQFHLNYARLKEYEHSYSVYPMKWKAMVFDKTITKEEFKTITAANYRGDQFWVRNPKRLPYKMYWRVRDYLNQSKPFICFPMLRDHATFFPPFPLQGAKESEIYKMCNEFEGTLFTQDFVFIPQLTPIRKYKKAIQNSMIWKYKPVTWSHKILPSLEFPAPRTTNFISGTFAFCHLLAKYDCKLMDNKILGYLKRTRKRVFLNQDWLNNAELFNLDKKQKRNYQRRITSLLSVIPKQARRGKLFRNFWRTYSRPEWMFLTVLPVLPPDLRPIIKMEGNQLAISDLNKLYQLVFYRNEAFKRRIMDQIKGEDTEGLPSTFSESNSFENNKNLPIRYEDTLRPIFTNRYVRIILGYHQRLLQEAIDALLDNGRGPGKTFCGNNDRPLKSLSDVLKGKKGRFRQNLLGKRVDYSGRSVIVVGPTLKLHECGLPKEIATELFQALLIKKLLRRNLARTIVGAKKLIHQEHPVIWPILNEVIETYPILLNRAPTLHRLGVQAFLPKLVRGKAVLLHPLVCPAFNADFDGDQMGIHLPLSMEAKSEAWSLMLATQNLLSPATGDPMMIPSQDMVLGCYYLTTLNSKANKQKRRPYFANLEQATQAYFSQNLHPHSYVWLKWQGSFYSDQLNSSICEMRVHRFGRQTTINPTLQRSKTFNGSLLNQVVRTTLGRIFLNLEVIQQVNQTSLKYFQPYD